MLTHDEENVLERLEHWRSRVDRVRQTLKQVGGLHEATETARSAYASLRQDLKDESRSLTYRRGDPPPTEGGTAMVRPTDQTRERSPPRSDERETREDTSVAVRSVLGHHARNQQAKAAGVSRRATAPSGCVLTCGICRTCAGLGIATISASATTEYREVAFQSRAHVAALVPQESGATTAFRARLHADTALAIRA
jgi:hypothetical protein